LIFTVLVSDKAAGVTWPEKAEARGVMAAVVTEADAKCRSTFPGEVGQGAAKQDSHEQK